MKIPPLLIPIFYSGSWLPCCIEASFCAHSVAINKKRLPTEGPWSMCDSRRFFTPKRRDWFDDFNTNRRPGTLEPRAGPGFFNSACAPALPPVHGRARSPIERDTPHRHLSPVWRHTRGTSDHRSIFGELLEQPLSTLPLTPAFLARQANHITPAAQN